MDWNNVVADKTMLLTKHYTPGRTQSIRGIVLHHNAANLTIEDCYNVWQNREASAHYQVENSGRIGQLVNDRDTAWHAGNANPWTIGIEHANNHIGDPWTISDACLDSGAHLVAALCKYYNLGEPSWLGNVFPHSYFMSTACPGEIGKSQNSAYMNKAKEYYRQMTGQSSSAGKWVKDNGGWWYQYADGSYPTSKWLKLDTWYYFGSDGYAICGKWALINGEWYLFDENCHMLTGWQKKNDTWYYLNENGQMVTGWLKKDGYWYWLQSDGSMAANKWVQVNNNWYYFYSDGSMAEATAINKNGTYLVGKDGAMLRSVTLNSDGSVKF